MLAAYADLELNLSLCQTKSALNGPALLEFLAAMPLTSLSKSVRTISLMVLLSTSIGTSSQQSAQSKPAACAPFPQGQFFNEFEGMTFSREQDRAFRKIAAAGKKRSQALSETCREVDSPDVFF
jgi:hypothetical protein